MKIKKITIGLASVLAASTLFSCGNNDKPNPDHNHNYVQHSATASTCAKKGNEEYYSCSECEKIFTKNGDSYTEIEKIPSIDFDSMNHEGTVEILVSGYNSNYEIGESIDTKFLNVLEKCEKCEGHTIPASFYEIQYPTAGENKFVAADVGSNKTVVIKYQNYTKEFSVTVSKKINEISGLPAIISKKCGDKPFSSFEGVTSLSGGEIVFKFAETEDGEYKTASELGDDYKFIVKSGESTTYYYKAIDAGNDEYNEVIKTGTILVEHNEDFDLNVLNYKNQYKIGEMFTLEGASFELKCCDDCEGVTVDASKVDWKIQNDEKRPFTEQDAGKTIKIEVSYDETYKKVVEVTVFAKSVVGLTDLEGHCGFEAFDHLDDVHVAEGLGNPTYSFSDTMDGEYKTKDQLAVDVFDVPEGETSRVIYFKTYLKGNDTFDDFEEIHTITLTHNYGWDTSDEKVDVFGCACSDPFEFDKFIENSQDVILSADKISVSLEETSYDSAKDTVKSIVLKNANPDGEIPDVSLGTDLTDLDFSNVPANTYGEQMIEVVVTNGAEGVRTAIDHVIEVPVVVVTDVIMNNKDSIKKVFAYKDDTRTYPITGYYVLGEDIDHSSYVFGWYSGWDSGDKNKFSGVIDGRNHTVKSKSSYSGAFGRLDNATIKNLTVTDAWYHNYNGNSLLASGMINTTLENVTMKVLANNDPIIEPNPDIVLGWVSRIQFQNCTVKNCLFDASGKIVSRLFSTNNSKNNTIIDSTFKCDKYYSIYNDYDMGEIYQMEGLTVEEGSVYSLLEKQNITIFEDKMTPTGISLDGDRFENATVNSITLGKYDLGNNIAALTFSDEAIKDETIRGDQNLILNITVNEVTFNYSVPVNVGFKSIREEDTLETRQYLLTETETASLSLAGTDYEGATIESIKLGGEDLGNDLSSITLPASIKEDKTKHIDYVVDVALTLDGDKYLVHIPVLVVTKAIGDWNTFASIFQGANKYSKDVYTTGSYILTADISISGALQVTGTDDSGAAWVGYGNAIITGSGFKGIFDGCGHKMTQTGGAIWLGGLFGVVTGGAIVRNVEICNFAAKADSSYSGILGVQFNNSTLENVTFNIASVTGTADKTGLICNQYFRNNTVKNVTINAQGSTVYNVLGGYWGANATAGGTTFENFVVNADAVVNAFSTNSWGGVVAYDGTNLPEGITVNITK